jgi:myo-inositol-1(or 4)-monophosphatase
MNANNLPAWLELALTAAWRAGVFLRQTADSPIVVESELGRDVKLAADTGSEEIILRVLREGSSLPILSEEMGLDDRQGSFSSLHWLVDPLDGSLNYLKGIPFCCVSIGLWDGPEPLLGVIYDFHREELFKGISGQGAWLNNKPMQVSPTREVEKAVLCTGFPVSTDYSPGAILQFVEQVRKYKKLRLWGSAALSLAYVAAGRADSYYERDIKLWDVGAGLALVRAAGGLTGQTASSKPFAITAYAGNGLLPNIEMLS